MSVRMVVAACSTTDCRQASILIEDIDAQYLLANKGYDTGAIITQTKGQGMEPVILLPRHPVLPRYAKPQGTSDQVWRKQIASKWWWKSSGSRRKSHIKSAIAKIYNMKPGDVVLQGAAS